MAQTRGLILVSLLLSSSWALPLKRADCNPQQAIQQVTSDVNKHWKNAAGPANDLVAKITRITQLLGQDCPITDLADCFQKVTTDQKYSVDFEEISKDLGALWNEFSQGVSEVDWNCVGQGINGAIGDPASQVSAWVDEAKVILGALIPAGFNLEQSSNLVSALKTVNPTDQVKDTARTLHGNDNQTLNIIDTVLNDFLKPLSSGGHGTPLDSFIGPLESQSSSLSAAAQKLL